MMVRTIFCAILISILLIHNTLHCCVCRADKFEPFVTDVEKCLKLYAQIEKIKFEDVPLLLFFYHSIMDLFSESMKKVSP
jgi:hypothetical protein